MRHTFNSLLSNTVPAHYKYKVFLDGEFLHAISNDAVKWITSITIKPNNTIHIKCDLVFGDKFPDYSITDEELYDEPNVPLIYFSVYTYQGICATHGIISNVPSVCRVWKGNDDIKYGLTKSPAHGKKKHITKMSCYIGEFHKLHDQPMLYNYA